MLWFRVKSYFNFLWHSTNQYGVHSPFVYALIIQCFYNRKLKPAYQKIKKFQELVNHKDSLSQTSISFKKSKLLHRLVHYFQPQLILDLSLSAGSVAVSISANKDIKIFTLETSEKEVDLIKVILQETGVENNKILRCFSSLEKTLSNFNRKNIDLIYWRQSKMMDSSIAVFYQLLPFVSKESIIIFDGIHQSAENESNWEIIKNHTAVQVTVDIFFWGLVFFKEGQAKQHFKVRV